MFLRWEIVTWWVIIDCVLTVSGLLLMIHGYNTTTSLTLGLGVLVVIVSTCGMPGAIFGCRWWRRRRRKQRRQAVFSSNGSTKLVDSSFHVVATESIAPPVVWLSYHLVLWHYCFLERLRQGHQLKHGVTLVVTCLHIATCSNSKVIQRAVCLLETKWSTVRHQDPTEAKSLVMECHKYDSFPEACFHEGDIILMTKPLTQVK